MRTCHAGLHFSAYCVISLNFFIVGDFKVEFVRVSIAAISTEECDVTFQVCVSVITRPVSSHMWQCSLHPVHALYCSLYVCGMLLCMLSCTYYSLYTVYTYMYVYMYIYTMPLYIMCIELRIQSQT